LSLAPCFVDTIKVARKIGSYNLVNGEGKGRREAKQLV